MKMIYPTLIFRGVLNVHQSRFSSPRSSEASFRQKNTDKPIHVVKLWQKIRWMNGLIVVFEFGIDLNKGLCVYLFDFFFAS